jgi:hypothetical protein
MEIVCDGGTLMQRFVGREPVVTGDINFTAGTT